MRIAVFGLGYVGTVTAACFSRDGHTVTGVDANGEKTGLVARGESPIIEAGVTELLRDGVARGRVFATTDARKAVRDSEISLISVGTPPAADGAPDLSYVFGVCQQIAAAVKEKGGSHVVVVRSTVSPGTLARCTEIFETQVGQGVVHCAFNPEFLREGSAVADYDQPPFTVIGTRDQEAEAVVRAMYAAVDAPVVVVEPEVAELVKYVSNAWHATKISFSNEVGRLAKSFSIDGRSVMSIAMQDTKLNVSAAYTKPGFAYGGSCLPKDLNALTSIARMRDISVPLLSSLAVTNTVQIDRAVRLVLAGSPKAVAVLGLAFKPGTDDLRESPAVPLVKRLLGEGCRVRIYDRDVHTARLMGTNLEYIRSTLPHFEALLVESAETALEGVDTAVVTYGAKEFAGPILDRCHLRVVDLAGLFTSRPNVREYHGSAW